MYIPISRRYEQMADPITNTRPHEIADVGDETRVRGKRCGARVVEHEDVEHD